MCTLDTSRHSQLSVDLRSICGTDFSPWCQICSISLWIHHSKNIIVTNGTISIVYNVSQAFYQPCIHFFESDVKHDVVVFTGPNAQSPASLSSWSQRMENRSSRGHTSVATIACTSTATAARHLDHRKWKWTVRTRGIQSGSGRRPLWWGSSHKIINPLVL